MTKEYSLCTYMKHYSKNEVNLYKHPVACRSNRSNWYSHHVSVTQTPVPFVSEAPHNDTGQKNKSLDKLHWKKHDKSQ